MTSTKRITKFRLSWTADHEQYFQGHSTMFTDYTHSGMGVGDTLREAFEDALEDLAQQDIHLGDMNKETDTVEGEMLADLQTQVKEPEMLDMSIVDAECPVKGKHKELLECCECDNTHTQNDTVCRWCYDQGRRAPNDPEILAEDGVTVELDNDDPDCAICAGEWHFYVMVDVKVEEGQ